MKIRTPHLLSLIILPLFLNGCMTMGWGGHYNNGSSQPADQQANLIKEQQVANQTVRATFPSTEAGQQVHFELETISQDTTNTPIESVVLEIQNPGNSGLPLATTTVKPDPTLSRQGYWIIPYRFAESGTYQITFIVNLNTKKSSSPHSISSHLMVSEPVAKYNRYNPLPWVASSAIMVGFMVWMMAN